MSDTSGLQSQFHLKINGSDAPANLMQDLLTVTVESSLHLPDVATIVLHDPSLTWIDSKLLEPGTALVISAVPPARSAVEGELFDGEIVELEPDLRAGNEQRLTIRAFNRLHRLARGTKVRTFVNVSDGDAIKKVASEAGLQAQVGPTTQVHPFVWQKNETDLEFVRTRAAALGYVLSMKGKTLHCDAPKANGAAVSLEWGVAMSEFHPRLTTVDQDSTVVVRSWDPVQKQPIVGQATNGQGAPQVGLGKTGGQMAQQAFGSQAQRIVTNYPVRTQGAAEVLAQAVADRIAGSFIEADGVCVGNPKIVAGAAVQLSKVGTRFSGTYLVTSAIHTYGHDEGYSTQFSVSGFHDATLLSVLGPPPEITRVPGLVIGIVTNNQDPDGLGRVKVKYPWLAADLESDWARVVVVGGGATRGVEFLPEVNDEVLVGFELGDVHQPYVLGGLWNGKDAPPKKNSEVVGSGKVEKRIIQSRSGHVIILDDTGDGNNGNITIQDKKGNKIVLDTKSDALTIEVAKNATIKAGGTMNIESTGKMTIKSSAQVEVSGMGATLDGGGANVEVKAGGPVNVKGAMINLN